MLYCKKCGAKMPDYSKFCSNCGQSFDNLPVSATPISDKTGKKGGFFYDKSTWVAFSLVFVVILFFVIFIFAVGNGDKTSHRKKNNVVADSTQIPADIHFTANTYEIETKQETDMSRYLNCSGIDKEQIQWSSNSDKAIVGSNGRIVIDDYDTSCELTAMDKNNQEMVSKCTVKTRSSQDDLVYRVQKLNGGHEQDETNDSGTLVVSTNTDESQKIDVDANNYKPAQRNKKYVWDRKLFYSLEDVSAGSDKDGKINAYKIEKKQFTNSDTNNDIEYEVYRNPDTNKINKVVSIEHVAKKLSITEYYYTNAGKVNFIYCYKDVNYVPAYATIDRKGQRFQFHRDTLVNWRIVDKNGEKNYCYGKAEKKSLRGHGGIKEYAKLSEKKKKEYDEKEKLMLNCAYNTLDKVENYEGVSSIRGYVNDGAGKSLEGTEVLLHSTDYNCDIVSSKTDQNGYYEIYVPARQSTYELEFSKDSFCTERLYNAETGTDKIGIYQENMYLAEAEETEYGCTLFFYDALNKSSTGEGMEQLRNVDVKIRKGVNNFSGDTIIEEHSSKYYLNIKLQPGMYTIQMSDDGYIDSYSTLFVSDESDKEQEIFATPRLNKDELRVVLTWGDTPADLDSHLFVPYKKSNDKNDYHVCYYHMRTSDNSTALDVDDTTGYGPETTSIYRMKKGQYKYYVADFTNCVRHNEESAEMSLSSAVVRVYGAKGLLQTFHVPTNRKGVIWEVFEIRDGTVVPIQRYYDTIGNKTWWSSAKRY